MHDVNGTPLKVGDKVVIPCKIMQISPTEEFCNVNLETMLGRKPDGQKESFAAINTAQVVKVSGDDVILGL